MKLNPKINSWVVNPRIRIAVLVVFIFLLGLLLKGSPKRAVLVAAAPLSPGHLIAPEDLQAKEVDHRLTPGGSIFSAQVNRVIGKSLIRVLATGEVLTWSALVGSDNRPSSEIPKGMRLAAVAIQNLEEMRPYLKGIERVDLLFTPRTDIKVNQNTYNFLYNVQIHSLTETMAGSLGFILPLREAMLVMHAQTMGIFSIVLRNPLESSNIAAEKETRISNQTVLQNLKGAEPVKPGIEIIYGNTEPP